MLPLGTQPFPFLLLPSHIPKPLQYLSHSPSLSCDPSGTLLQPLATMHAPYGSKTYVSPNEGYLQRA